MPWLPKQCLTVISALCSPKFPVSCHTALMGAEHTADWAKVPIESLGTAAAAFICWPLYRRIAGWEDDRLTRARRRRL